MAKSSIEIAGNDSSFLILPVIRLNALKSLPARNIPRIPRKAKRNQENDYRLNDRSPHRPILHRPNAPPNLAIWVFPQNGYGQGQSAKPAR